MSQQQCNTPLYMFIQERVHKCLIQSFSVISCLSAQIQTVSRIYSAANQALFVQYVEFNFPWPNFLIEWILWGPNHLVGKLSGCTRMWHTEAVMHRCGNDGGGWWQHHEAQSLKKDAQVRDFFLASASFLFLLKVSGTLTVLFLVVPAVRF